MTNQAILNRTAGDCIGKDYQERMNRALELALKDGRSLEVAQDIAEEAMWSRWDKDDEEHDDDPSLEELGMDLGSYEY